MTRGHLLVGCGISMVSGKKPPDSMPYPAPRRDRTLLPTIDCSARYRLDPFAQEKFSLSLKTHGPSEREVADKIE